MALPAPSDRERTQWYFQRYVPHLPAAGEIVLFDRSWYNRAGVERVMKFCSEEDVEEFFRSVPEFERMLVRSGIKLIKYWFSITDEEQYLRFLARVHDPLKQWKLSPMDLESRRRWEDYTRAKEIMLARTHITEAPWWVVQAVEPHAEVENRRRERARAGAELDDARTRADPRSHELREPAAARCDRRDVEGIAKPTAEEDRRCGLATLTVSSAWQQNSRVSPPRVYAHGRNAFVTVAGGP